MNQMMSQELLMSHAFCIIFEKKMGAYSTELNKIVVFLCFFSNYNIDSSIFDGVNQQQNLVNYQMNRENAGYAAGMAERDQLVQQHYR